MVPTSPKCIIERTIQNLVLGEQLSNQKVVADDPPFEVTQLVNSFLAVLVHPWERLRRKSVDLEDFPRPDDTGSPPTQIQDRITNMRHAMAHGNLRFLGSREIEEVVLWNKIRSNGKCTWKATLTVQDLRSYLTCFQSVTQSVDEDELRVAVPPDCP